MSELVYFGRVEDKVQWYLHLYFKLTENNVKLMMLRKGQCTNDNFTCYY